MMKTTWALSTFKLRNADQGRPLTWNASDPGAPQPDIHDPVEWTDATPKLSIVGRIDDEFPLPVRTSETVRPAA